MLSHRLEWDLTPNRLSEILARKRAAGAAILDLTESNPTRAGFAYPEAAIREALAPPEALVYAPEPRGLPAARAAVADYCRGRGAAVAAGDVVLTAGTSDGYGYLLKLLTDPGDQILVPAPSYPLLPMLADLEGARLVEYPLRWREGAGWRPDLDALAASIGPRARAVIAVSPHNPTGSVLRPAELARLDALCAGRGLALIVDEVFLDYPADGPAPGSAAAGERAALTFVLSGLSKVAGLPQLKLSWIVAAGPRERRESALAGLELIADAYLAVGTPIQHAAARLLAGAGAARDQIRSRLLDNERWLRERCAGLAAGRLLPREGGWYAVLEAWTVRDEEAWTAALLEADDVLVHPGYFFDFPRAGYLVVSLLTPPEALRAGIEKALARLP